MEDKDPRADSINHLRCGTCGEYFEVFEGCSKCPRIGVKFSGAVWMNGKNYYPNKKEE